MDRDPMVTQYVPGPWSDRKEHRAFVLERMKYQYPDGRGYWTVEMNDETNDFLGWILLLPYQLKAYETEIGWRFTRMSWGRGYATEAASVILKHAHETLGLKLIIADIDSRNAASIRVAEKIGLYFTEDRDFDGWLAKSYQSRPNNR